MSSGMQNHLIGSLAALSLLFVACSHQDRPGHPHEDPTRSDGGHHSHHPSGGPLGPLDMSATERYVSLGEAMARVEGTVTEFDGDLNVMVEGESISMHHPGHFMTEVPLAEPGVHSISVRVEDETGARRQGDLNVIHAEFLPADEMNLGSTSLVVTDEILDAILIDAPGATTSISAAWHDVDIDGRSCRRRVQHDPVEPRLEVVDGLPTVQVRFPGLEVQTECSEPPTSEGTVTPLFRSTTVRGNLVIRVALYPAAGDGPCIRGFEITPMESAIEDSSASFELEDDSMSDAMTRMALSRLLVEQELDGLRHEVLEGLYTLFSDTPAYEERGEVNVMGTPVEIHLCATALQNRGGHLFAEVGSQVSSEANRIAPGVPTFPAPPADGAEDEMLLDTALIAQLVYGAWVAGGLDLEIDSVGSIRELLVIASGLAEYFEPDTLMSAQVTAELAPVIELVPASVGEGDIQITLPDMRLALKASGMTVAEVLLTIRMRMELVPDDAGSLSPVLIDVETAAVLVDEPLSNINDRIFESVIGARVEGMTEDLLDGASFGFPSFGATLSPVDVQPHENGRYLRVRMR